MRGTLVVGLWLAVTGCDTVFDLESVPPPPPPAEPGTWAMLEAGAGYSCGLRLDGSLWCWGTNEEGQLGLGPGATSTIEPAVVGSATWSTISTGHTTTCGVQTDTTLWCWGANDKGTVGDGTTEARFGPVMIGSGYLTVSVGKTHACAVAADGALWCWGENVAGQLGTGGYVSVAVPTRVTSPVAFSSVVTGVSHTCALGAEGSAWCWGANGYGQLGIGSYAGTFTPAKVDDRRWLALTAGNEHTCGIREDGALRCWGSNLRGQIGFPSSASYYVRRPAGVDVEVDAWIAVSAGGEHTCAVTDERQLWCWGADADGQIGPERALPGVPRAIDDGADEWEQVAAGIAHTCGIGADHNLWCFGAGTNTSASETSPVQVPGSYRHVATSRNTTCALDLSSQVSCWGENNGGAVGDETYLDRTEPTLVSLRSFTAIAGGDDSMCAIDLEGGLYCWGSTSAGIGDGSQIQLVPTPVSPGTLFTSVSLGSAHSCALQSGTQSVHCWGSNYYGQFGTGVSDTTTVLQPTLALAGPWAQLTVANQYTCGVSPTGAACWGSGAYGSLGTGGNASALTPTPIGAFTSVVTNPFSYVTCGIAAAGEGACWGYSYYSQLGNGSQVNAVQYAPTPISGGHAWSLLRIGGTHTCGIRTDRTLWCWGSNYAGQLGEGTTTQSLVPVQIGTDKGWRDVALGFAHSCALREDDTLWCWGSNQSGQLGLGTQADTGGPVLVP